jgi:peptidoglycan/LPS O-acetylase OafA/YrhL
MLFLGTYLNVYTFIAVIYPIVLLFAVLSWKIVESPALKLKKSELIKGVI